MLQHTLDAVQAGGLPWHLEDADHPGMGDSIAAAVRATSHAAIELIVNDVGCVTGIDTVEDLRTAARLMRGA